MSETKPMTGGCLCGAVRFSASIKGGAGACHCETCRKWSSGPLMCVNADGPVDFEGAENLSRYRSSDWAERGFCARCGSTLFYHLLPGQMAPEGMYILSAGALDDQSGLVFDHEVFVDKNPGWYAFAGEEARNRMTEADILKMVGAAPSDS